MTMRVMKKATTILFCALLVVAAVGCQDAPSATESAPRIAPADFRVHLKMPEPPGQTLSPETLEARAAAQTEVTKTLYRILQQAGNWREADGQVRTLLATSSLPPYALEQTAATLMLRTQLLVDATADDGPEPNPEKLAAIAFYTELLVEHESPEGRVVAEALQALDGYWSNQKRAAVAARAAAATEAFLAKRLDCTDCPDPLAALDASTEASNQVVLDKAVIALQDLRAMSPQ